MTKPLARDGRDGVPTDPTACVPPPTATAARPRNICRRFIVQNKHMFPSSRLAPRSDAAAAACYRTGAGSGEASGRGNVKPISPPTEQSCLLAQSIGRTPIIEPSSRDKHERIDEVAGREA